MISKILFHKNEQNNYTLSVHFNDKAVNFPHEKFFIFFYLLRPTCLYYERLIEQAISSEVKELKGFAKGILSDLAAVRNAMSLPWSNGQIEGQVNKLKLIKRQMYGRLRNIYF